VVEKQSPNGLSSYTWDQLALDGFLHHQTHGPAGAAFWNVATYHGDNPLFLAVIQHSGGTWALLLEERGLQTATLVAMADSANGLRSK
jgi:hypothetical protein